MTTYPGWDRPTETAGFDPDRTQFIGLHRRDEPPSLRRGNTYRSSVQHEAGAEAQWAQVIEQASRTVPPSQDVTPPVRGRFRGIAAVLPWNWVRARRTAR